MYWTYGTITWTYGTVTTNTLFGLSEGWMSILQVFGKSMVVKSACHDHLEWKIIEISKTEIVLYYNEEMWFMSLIKFIENCASTSMCQWMHCVVMYSNRKLLHRRTYLYVLAVPCPKLKAFTVLGFAIAQPHSNM